MSTDHRAGSLSKSVQKHAGRAKERMSILHLHEHPELLEDCTTLLNGEWKRSRTARIHYLEKCCRELPCSLVLVEFSEGKPKVFGHSRLACVVEDPSGCLISSVLVDKEYRGMGFGRILMTETEEFAKAQGFRTAYLCTRDKQQFYEHLGYSYCGGMGMTTNSLPSYRLNTFVTSHKPSSSIPPYKNTQEINRLTNKMSSLSSPAPPPPPLPVISDSSRDNEKSYTGFDKQIWMKKELI